MNAETVENAKTLPGATSFTYNINNVNSRMRKPLINDSDSFTRLKLKINNLLWEELPGTVTLERAEEIACGIMARFMGEKEKQ